MEFQKVTVRRLEIIKGLTYKVSANKRKPGILTSGVYIKKEYEDRFFCVVYISADTLNYIRESSLKRTKITTNSLVKSGDYYQYYYEDPLIIANSEVRFEVTENHLKDGTPYLQVEVLRQRGVEYEKSFYEQWREDEPEKAKADDIRWEKEEKENSYSDPWDSIGPDEGWSRDGRPD